MTRKGLGQFAKVVKEVDTLKLRIIVDKHTCIREFRNTRITKLKVLRVRDHAKNIVDGSFKEQYRRIYDYTHELLRSNSGYTIKMKVELGHSRGHILATIGRYPNDQMLPIAYEMDLLPTLDEWFSGINKRFCVQHLYNNFRKKIHGK
ncbi:hypothetical protein CR513_00997, partial [Mucuna pruriens]